MSKVGNAFHVLDSGAVCVPMIVQMLNVDIRDLTQFCANKPSARRARASQARKLRHLTVLGGTTMRLGNHQNLWMANLRRRTRERPPAKAGGFGNTAQAGCGSASESFFLISATS